MLVPTSRLVERVVALALTTVAKLGCFVPDGWQGDANGPDWLATGRPIAAAGHRLPATGVERSAFARKTAAKRRCCQILDSLEVSCMSLWQ
jgi:hypothetical protein